MIELERHIEILLLNNDCVIVPDLGGFMAHHVDARYEGEDHTFLPPLRTLGFNPQLKINDSLLAQSYVEAYDISYPEALQRIEDEVNELKIRLSNEGFYEMDDLGTLSLNEDGNYLFTPCEAGILTPSLYGLGSFSMPYLTQSQPQQEEPVAEEEPTASIISMSRTETIDAETDNETEQEENDDFVRIKFSWIRNTVAVAAILLAIFLLALPSGKTEMMTRSISNLNNNILFGMMCKDTNTSTIDIKKDDIKKNESPADSLLKNTKEEAPGDVKKDSLREGYCIVLASYVTKRNANEFVENLQKRGYQESEVYTHRNVTRVIYGNFETQSEAYNVLRKMHRETDLAEAWVMKLNSKDKAS